MKWVIARPINGICLNGDEYALDSDGDIRTFDTRQSAYACYIASGGCKDDIESGAYSIRNL